MKNLQGIPTPELFIPWWVNWNPEMIPGLGLDLDASYGVLNSVSPDVPASDGQTVRRWLDKSGNGLHYDQTIASNQPSFSVAGLNGRPCLSFDGVNDWMRRVSVSLLQNVDAALIILVFEPTGNGSNQTAIFFSTDAGSTISRVSVGPDSLGGYRYGIRPANNVLYSGNWGTLSGAAELLTVKLGYLAANASFQVGSDLVNISPFGSGVSSGNYASLSTGVGGSGSTYLKGKIARVLVWPRALTASELAQVHLYLSQKYKIPLSP